jgi:hypothetical protein
MVAKPLGLKWLRRTDDHFTLICAEIKNAWRCTSTPAPFYETRRLIKYKAYFAAFGMDDWWFGIWELRCCVSSRRCVQSNSRTKCLQWALGAFLFGIKVDWSWVWYWPSWSAKSAIVTATLTNYVCLISSGFVCFQWNLYETSIFKLLDIHICWTGLFGD